MIISAFTDGQKRNKIAEFYDTDFPCLFMRGILTQAQEQEKEIELTFTARESLSNDKEMKR